jgi:hypothetical protein
MVGVNYVQAGIGITRLERNGKNPEEDRFEIEDSEMEKIHLSRAELRELKRLIIYAIKHL